MADRHDQTFSLTPPAILSNVFLAARLRDRPEKRKILIVVSDGGLSTTPRFW
jgi:hypothetical protein